MTWLIHYNDLQFTLPTKVYIFKSRTFIPCFFFNFQSVFLTWKKYLVKKDHRIAIQQKCLVKFYYYNLPSLPSSWHRHISYLISTEWNKEKESICLKFVIYVVFLWLNHKKMLFTTLFDLLLASQKDVGILIWKNCNLFVQFITRALFIIDGLFVKNW